MLASSNKTLSTIILQVVLGKWVSSFLVVIHTLDFVLYASFLYFKASKKVMSFLLAEIKGFISFIIKLSDSFIFGKICFTLSFFFFKKKI